MAPLIELTNRSGLDYLQGMLDRAKYLRPVLAEIGEDMAGRWPRPSTTRSRTTTPSASEVPWSTPPCSSSAAGKATSPTSGATSRPAHSWGCQRGRKDQHRRPGAVVQAGGVSRCEQLKFLRTTASLVPPAGWDQQRLPCQAIPITDMIAQGFPLVKTCWLPSAAELASLNAGGRVTLSVIGTKVPGAVIKFD